MHSDNDLAKHFALNETMISMAAEQIPPSAIARMVSVQSAHHRKTDAEKKKGGPVTTIIWEPLLSDLDKKEDVIYGMIKKLSSSEQNRGKIKGKGGRKGRIDGQ